MKFSSYASNLNILSSKVLTLPNELIQNDIIVSKLKSNLNDTITDIEKRQQRILKDLKAQLKIEMEQNKVLYEKLKSFET